MTPDKLNHIRQTLTEACDKHLANGGHITSLHFVLSEYRCPIGCLVGKVENKISAANDLLGLEHGSNELWDFIYAFDRCESNNYRDLAVLGREFRHKYLTKKQGE